MSQRTHSARLNALAAALCALLLLVALGIMDANGAPWWALVATQGALLVTTASAGIWLDRSLGARREAGGERTAGPDDPLWWARLERAQQARWRRWRAGVPLPREEDEVFWQERMSNQREEKN